MVHTVIHRIQTVIALLPAKRYGQQIQILFSQGRVQTHIVQIIAVPSSDHGLDAILPMFSFDHLVDKRFLVTIRARQRPEFLEFFLHVILVGAAVTAQRIQTGLAIREQYGERLHQAIQTTVKRLGNGIVERLQGEMQCPDLTLDGIQREGGRKTVLHHHILVGRQHAPLHPIRGIACGQTRIVNETATFAKHIIKQFNDTLEFFGRDVPFGGRAIGTK